METLKYTTQVWIIDGNLHIGSTELYSVNYLLQNEVFCCILLRGLTLISNIFRLPPVLIN